MLKIKRRLGESLWIDDLEICVTNLDDGLVRLGIGTSPVISVEQGADDTLLVGQTIAVKTIIASKGRVYLGVLAPPTTRVERGELRAKQKAASGGGKMVRARYNTQTNKGTQ